MRVGSLFTGIGGFDLGLERAGMEPVYQVEIDKTCNAVLARHWERVRRHDDITRVPSGDLAAVDLICGGFPCQDLSVAGRREGLAGERSGLWFEFHRVLTDARPRWCVVENVPGLLTSDAGRDFAIVVRGLVELGYGVSWRVLDAQHFGLAQRRERVFIVGSLGTFASAQVLFEPESMPGDPPPRREEGEGPAATVRGGSPGGSSHGKPSGTDRGPFVVARPLGGATVDGGQRTTDLDHGAFVVDARGLGDGEVVPTMVGDHMNRVTDYTPIIAAPLRSRSAPNSNAPGRGGEDDENIVVGPIAPNAGPRSHDAGNFHSNQGVDAGHILVQATPDPSYAVQGVGSKFGSESEAQDTFVFESRVPRNDRGAPGPIVPPLKAESGRSGKGDSAPLLGTPIAVRRLTPLECERLQGFPDEWTAGHSDSARYRMLGNAVAVPVAQWIARRIMEVDHA